MIIPVQEIWPDTVPLPYCDYSGAPRLATITSSPETPVIQRRSRLTKSYGTLAVKWVLSISQMNQFKSFFDNNLGAGTASFIIELRFPKNSDLSLWIVKFMMGYTCEYKEGIWEVTSDLDMVQLAVV